MILLIAIMFIVIAIGIGLSLFFLGRFLIQKSKESNKIVSQVFFVILCILFAMISSAAIIFAVILTFAIISFINDFLIIR